MQYTETQLDKLIADVEKEFSTHLAKAEEDQKDLTATPVSEEAPVEILAKAEEKKPEEKKDEAKEEQKPEAKDAKPAEVEGEKKPEAEAKPAEEAKPEDAPTPAADAGHDYDEEDMAHLKKMYMSMSKGELLAHHDMAKSALDEMAKCGDISQEKPAMTKSEEIKPIEIKTEESKPNQEVELLKSELTASNAKFEELKKNFDAVAAFLTKLVEKKTAPAAKAITSLDVIAKSEGAGEEEKTLTKSEIDSALNKKASDPSLKKADRDAINAYYLSDAGINSINHLLK